MPYFMYYALVVHGRCTPFDEPPYSTVYYYFRRWQKRGFWEQMNSVLREQVRMKQGKSPGATAAIVDSQSVKTTEKKGKYLASTVAN